MAFIHNIYYLFYTAESSPQASYEPRPQVSQGVQTEYEFGPVVYEAQIDLLRREIEQLKNENLLLSRRPIGFDATVGYDDDLCIFYTGLHISVIKAKNELNKLKFIQINKCKASKNAMNNATTWNELAKLKKERVQRTESVATSH